jgi:acyl carrier protein
MAGLLASQISNRRAKREANIRAVSVAVATELKRINHHLKRFEACRSRRQGRSRSNRCHGMGLAIRGAIAARVCLRGATVSEGVMAEGTGISVRDQISAIVEALLAKRVGARSVAADQNLTEAGLTSLDMVNLMLSIEDEFGIEIPQRRMTPANFRSIAAIEQLVSGLALAA